LLAVFLIQLPPLLNYNTHQNAFIHFFIARFVLAGLPYVSTRKHRWQQQQLRHWSVLRPEKSVERSK